MDVDKEDTIKNCFEVLKKDKITIDLLVNNAGIVSDNIYQDPTQIENEEMLQVFQTNVGGVLSVTNILFPLFNEKKKTIVINMSSISAR